MEPFVDKLKEIFTEEKFPLIHDKLIREMQKVVQDNEVTVYHVFKLTEGFMHVLQNVDMPGTKKRELVKQIFRVMNDSFFESGETFHVFINIYIDNNLDEIINELVKLAPRLFKRSFWTKMGQKIKKCC